MGRYKTLIEKYKEKQQEYEAGLFATQSTRNPESIQKVTKLVKEGKSLPELQLLKVDDYERMRKNAVMKSREDELKEKRLRDEQREKQLEAARAKKDKLIAIE
jgi:hypothetical protein